MERIILVDEQDREIGSEEKLAAHRDGGRLHRAFSILLFDAHGDMLLQQRSTAKYHFGGAWTNACCGHPRPGETTTAAARRRMGEELGVQTDLREVFAFTYSAADTASGLTEREFDHVFVGELDLAARPDPSEIEALRWVGPSALASDIAARPQAYSPWFRVLVARMGEFAEALPPSWRS